MMIHKINPFVDYNQWLKRLDTLLNDSTLKCSIKVLNVVKPINKKKLYHTTLGTAQCYLKCFYCQKTFMKNETTQLIIFYLQLYRIRDSRVGVFAPHPPLPKKNTKDISYLKGFRTGLHSAEMDLRHDWSKQFLIMYKI